MMESSNLSVIAKVYLEHSRAIRGRLDRINEILRGPKPVSTTDRPKPMSSVFGTLEEVSHELIAASNALDELERLVSDQSQGVAVSYGSGIQAGQLSGLGGGIPR